MELTKFRIGDRRSGKTTAILEWMKECLEDGGHSPVIVSPIQAHADMLYRRAKREGLDVNTSQFVSFSAVQRGVLRGRNVRVGIDEAQYILHQLCSDLEYVTATGEYVGHNT